LFSTETRAKDTFTEFFAECEPKLRCALVASCGPEVGREAAADALEYAWSHWDRIRSMEYPVAYLYRVGRSASRRYRATPRLGDTAPESRDPWVEPRLGASLDLLSERQRLAVVLRYSFGYTLDEIAHIMGVSITTVQKHVERGLMKLRRELEVTRCPM
jgi:RNA polymerase sigma factor (sigma-70 family)